MKNFYFVDNETGEDFIVEAENPLDAIRIACTYFKEPIIQREISDYEAEMIGVDTYQKGEKMSKKKTDTMTVGRLKSILAKYDNEQIVTIWGGENENGDFGCLAVCDTEEDAIWGDGDMIMLYENQKGDGNGNYNCSRAFVRGLCPLQSRAF